MRHEYFDEISGDTFERLDKYVPRKRGRRKGLTKAQRKNYWKWKKRRDEWRRENQDHVTLREVSSPNY